MLQWPSGLVKLQPSNAACPTVTVVEPYHTATTPACAQLVQFWTKNWRAINIQSLIFQCFGD